MNVIYDWNIVHFIKTELNSQCIFHLPLSGYIFMIDPTYCIIHISQLFLIVKSTHWKIISIVLGCNLIQNPHLVQSSIHGMKRLTNGWRNTIALIDFLFVLYTGPFSFKYLDIQFNNQISICRT